MDELERADRFYRDRDRKRFICGRGALRILLGGYLQLNPVVVRFIYGEYGKPFIAENPADPRRELCFNLSHSDNVALYAFGYGRRIGIDLERIGRKNDHTSLARRYLTPQEFRRLMSVSPPDQQREFLAFWTRREAFLKAQACGLSADTSCLGVNFYQIEGQKSSQYTLDDGTLWQMVNLDAGSNFCAALVYEGQACNVVIRDWFLGASGPCL